MGKHRRFGAFEHFGFSSSLISTSPRVPTLLLVGRGQPLSRGRRVRHAVDGPPPVVRLVVAHGARARLVGAAAELRAFVGARALAAAGDQVARRERISRVRDQIIKKEAVAVRVAPRAREVALLLLRGVADGQAVPRSPCPPT